MGKTEAILLAAGYSSRMGALKPLLPLGDTTVIRRQAEMLGGVVDRTIVVVGFQAETVKAHLHGYHVSIVENPEFARGMFTSVQAGIMALSHDTEEFLVLPVDYPLVTGELIKELLTVYFHSPSSKVGYPSYGGRRGHPPVISASCILGILRHNGEQGLKGALAPYNETACYLESEDRRCVMDMDTPVDYQEILEMTKANSTISFLNR